MKGIQGKPKHKRSLLLISLAVGVTGIIIGVLIGYFTAKRSSDGPCLGPGVPDNIISEGDDAIMKKIIDSVSADNIRNNLR